MAHDRDDCGSEVEQLRRDMKALLESARVVMTYRHFNEAARAVFDTCRQLAGARAGFAAIAAAEPGGELLFLESDGKPCAVNPPTPPQVASLMGEARRTAAPVLQNSVPDCLDMVCVPWGEIAVENILLVPLVAGAIVEGFIGLVNKPGGFTEHDVGLATAFAEHAVLALANSRTLDALEESRERFRAVVESAADAIITVDARGLVVGWNPAATRLFERTGEEMLRRPVTEIIPEEHRTQHQEAMERARAGGLPAATHAVELTALRADGTRFPVEIARRRWESAQGVFSTAIVRDISARQAVEQRVRESEELFRIVAETSLSLLSLRDRDGRMRWNNPASRATLGYRPDDEPPPFEIIHPDDRERVKSAWAAMVAGGPDGDRVPFRCRTAGGNYVHLESSTRRITANGETLFWVNSRDVTELVTLRRKTLEAGVEGLVGSSAQMQEVFVAIRELARANVPVLVQGESGTGKEVVANAIHRLGPRGAHSFVPVNCAALPEQLLESELFGHVRGAFTGAIRDKKGRFELADGGTIFIDEVAEISPAVQVKLLRVLQEGVFERVGAEQPTKVDVRVISATNRELRSEVAAGRFREDLFYRLGVVDLTLPPLRVRPTDIPLLVEHILGEEAGRAGQRAAHGRPRRFSVTPQTLALLVAHPWPGNVRELQNALRHAIVKAHDGRIFPQHLPRHILSAAGAAAATTSGIPARRSRTVLNAAAVNEALEKTGGHRGKAAKLLGVSRATFYRFLSSGDRLKSAPTGTAGSSKVT